MTYNLCELEARVKRLRKELIIKLIISLAVLVLSAIMLAIDFGDAVNLAFAGFIVCAIMYIGYTVGNIQPKVVFSKEIKGINIKEDEYVTKQSGGPGLRYRQEGARTFGGPPIAPNTGANKKRTPPSLRSAVYLRVDDGDVVMLRDLYKVHTDIYLEGDTLLKPNGAKYPIILNRTTDKQPCPLCGEVNDNTKSSCHGCGLSIIREAANTHN